MFRVVLRVRRCMYIACHAERGKEKGVYQSMEGVDARERSSSSTGWNRDTPVMSLGRVGGGKGIFGSGSGGFR